MESDLFGHLEELVERLDEGDTGAAVPLLQDFLGEVESLEEAGSLAPGDGEALTRAAERLIERLEGAD